MTLTYQGKLFAEYPDVVSVKQMCIMLGGISMKTAYKLLGNGEISPSTKQILNHANRRNLK